MADVRPGDGDAAHLKKYWLYGKGALKIRWGQSGDWTRCVRQLTPHLDGNTERAKRLCATYHRQAVGFWPGDRRNK